MDCGDGGHILVSRITADLLKQVGGWNEIMHDIGEVPVKHGVIVYLYNVYQSEFGNPEHPHKLRISEDVTLGDVVLDRYRLLENLGTGGVGTVFRAVDLQSDSLVAIKIINRYHAKDPETARQFQTELLVTQKVQHPGIAKVYEVARLSNGRPCAVLELVRGSDLSEILSREGALPVVRSLRLVTQIADALAAAHSSDICHNDLKLDNIIVEQTNNQENAKITDFGMATVRSSVYRKFEKYATGPNWVIGTWESMPPEWLSGTSDMSRAAAGDVYSIGAILYHMLTGQPPFSADRVPQFLMDVLKKRPDPPHEKRPDRGIPHELSLVVLKALEKNPCDRYQSAGELLRALKQIEP